MTQHSERVTAEDIAWLEQEAAHDLEQAPYWEQSSPRSAGEGTGAYLRCRAALYQRIASALRATLLQEDGPSREELIGWIHRHGVCSEACLESNAPSGECVCGLDDLLSRLPATETNDAK